MHKLINHLDHLEDISGYIYHLAKLHQEKFIREEQFNYFAQALFVSLEARFKDKLDQQHQKAWLHALELLRNRFLLDEVEKGSDHEINKLLHTINEDQIDGFLPPGARSSPRVVIPPSKPRKESSEIGTEEDSYERIDSTEVKEFYLNKFRNNIDFHHAIAYKFEKAYRLQKQLTHIKRRMFNMEIIDCISEHSGYLESDTNTVFYCLFFAIFYRNVEIVDFFREVSLKLQRNDHIDYLLEQIDIYGVPKLRTPGE